MRRVRTLALALPSMLLACGGPHVTHLVQQPINLELTSMLCVPGATPLRVKSIDGKPGPSHKLGYGAANGAFKIYVRKGKRLLAINYDIETPENGLPPRLEENMPWQVDLEAEHTYTIRLEPGPEQYEPVLVDVTDDPGPCTWTD